MKKFVVIILLLLVSPILKGQNYEKEFKTIAAWEVHQIGQFIDRFNDTDTSFTNYYQLHYPGKVLTRKQLIKWAFNSEGKTWNLPEINNFINEVNNRTNPVFLDFYNDNWYANLNCSVTWKGKPKIVSLKLRVIKDENGSVKWIVTGVNAKFLMAPASKGESNKLVSFKLPLPQDTTTSLEPTSNNTEFMDIDKVSSDKKNIANYFYKKDNYNDQLPRFVTECQNGSLVIDQVNSIIYCFSQIKGWNFEVRQYHRQTKNSGWLISSLMRDDAEKKKIDMPDKKGSNAKN